jgi:membrane associated rhomboid family serine protease
MVSGKQGTPGDDAFREFAAWRPPDRRSTFVSRFWRSIRWRNWPVSIVVLVCIGVFAAQVIVPLPYERWGLSGVALSQGRYETIFTNLFMHAGVLHLLSNVIAYLAVAPVVCARFGTRLSGQISFHAFFLLCGLAGAGTFLALNPQGDIPVVGASGAIYGLFAALYRLDMDKDELNKPFSKRVLAGWKWMVISNLVLVFYFGGVATMLEILEGNPAPLRIPIAWECHAGGFIAGLVLAGVMIRKGWDDDWRGGYTPDD